MVSFHTTVSNCADPTQCPHFSVTGAYKAVEKANGAVVLIVEATF